RKPTRTRAARRDTQVFLLLSPLGAHAQKSSIDWHNPIGMMSGDNRTWNHPRKTLSTKLYDFNTEPVI
ncbi:MAG TPA: hypothetical protein VH143_33920, partial [Kofleriaceae bacterium]|nr:hypothetical protein [Kofleriaceae bacterium]